CFFGSVEQISLFPANFPDRQVNVHCGRWMHARTVIVEAGLAHLIRLQSLKARILNHCKNKCLSNLFNTQNE
ncbi:hypothetical protein, partial [Alteromonas sp. W364]|uniref:hypothetical protein n=1 Tax=Alteromonas sp. W364 TaxID=3075610 RepID=UPI0028878D65